MHVLGCVQRKVHARRGREVTTPQPARDHDAVGEHGALVGLDAGRAPVLVQNRRDRDALADAHPGLMRELRDRGRGVAGVHVPVVGKVHARPHALGRGDRPQLRDLARVNRAHVDAVLHGDVARVEQLVDAPGRSGEAERTAALERHIEPRALFELGIERQAIRRQLCHGGRPTRSRDEPSGVPRRSTGEHRALEQQHVGLARLSEVQSDARADDAAAHDHRAGPARQCSRRLLRGKQVCSERAIGKSVHGEGLLA